MDMSLNNHEHARTLLAKQHIEGLPDFEQRWLDEHVTGCGDCAAAATALTAAIRDFRSLPVSASPELVQRTAFAVRRRARELQAEKMSAAPMWIAALLCSALMIFTLPLVWDALGRFGRLAQAPVILWQTAILMWWFMPATIVAAAAACRKASAEARRRQQ